MDIRAYQWGIVFLLAISLTLSFILTFLLTQNMRIDFKKINISVQSVLEGGFTNYVDLEQWDQIGQIVKAFNKMIFYFNDLVTRIKQNSKNIQAFISMMSAITE